MIRTRARRRAEAQLLSDLNDLLRPRPRIPVLGAGWRWRYELALVAGLAAVVGTLLYALGGEWTVICLSALAGVVTPPWPEPVMAAAWRIVTPHRLRSGFAKAGIQSRDGRPPFVVRTTSEPFGERVRLWCPAGTSAEDLRAARALLRTACWATDVRVIPDERHAHMVTIDVIRTGPAALALTAPDPAPPGHTGPGAAGDRGPTPAPAPGTGAAAPAARRTPAPAPGPAPPDGGCGGCRPGSRPGPRAGPRTGPR